MGAKLYVSDLFIMTDTLNLPQMGRKPAKIVGRYVVNGLFGNDEFESILRVTLTTKKESTKKFCDAVIGAQASKSKLPITVTSRNLVQCQNMVNQGVLSRT